MFLCRALVATVLCATAPVLDPEGLWLALGLALAYIPFAAFVPGSRARSGGTLVLSVGADAVVLFAFGAVVGRSDEVGLVGLFFVGLHTWGGGRSAGLAMTGAAVAGLVLAGAAGDGSSEPATVLTTAAMAVLLAFLIDEQTTQRSRAASGLRLVSDKAEAILAGIADAVVTTTADGRVRTRRSTCASAVGTTASA